MRFVEERNKILEREIEKMQDENRILKLRLQTARKILDDIAQMADRIN